MKNYESGRSMVEMLAVMAIMGIITVAAISMISVAMRGQKRSVIVDEISQMVAGVRSILGGYDDFSGIDNSRIFGALGMSNRNVYGGSYQINANPSNTQQFVISIDGLSESDCEFFTARAWTDSVGYILSDGKQSGATGDCRNINGKNIVKITFGE